METPAICNCEAQCCEGTHAMGACKVAPEGNWVMDYLGTICDGCASRIVAAGGGQYVHPTQHQRDVRVGDDGTNIVTP